MRSIFFKKTLMVSLASAACLGGAATAAPAHAVLASPTVWGTVEAAPSGTPAQDILRWQVNSPVISSGMVGKIVHLDMVVSDGKSAIDCNTLAGGYRSKVTGKWMNLSPDYTRSGCWVREGQWAIKITKDMVGASLQLGGRAYPYSATTAATDYRFKGKWYIAGGDSSAQVTLTVSKPAESSSATSTTPTLVLGTSNNTLTWKVQSETITSSMVGKQMFLEVVPDDNSRTSCKGWDTGLRKADGTFVHVEQNWYDSGCWAGGGKAALVITDAMVGGRLEYSGFGYTSSGVAIGTKTTLTGKSTLDGVTKTVQATAATVGGTATAAPSPSASSTPTTSSTPTATSTPSTPSGTDTTSSGLVFKKTTISGYNVVTVVSPTITSDLVGKTVFMKLTPDDNTRFLAGEPLIVTRKADGAVGQALMDYSQNGGWEGGGQAAVPVLPEMVGTKLEYSALFYTTAGVAAGKTSTITGTSVFNSTTTATTTVTTLADGGKPATKIVWAPLVDTKDSVGGKSQVPVWNFANGSILKGDAYRGQDVWLNGELVAHPESAPEVNSSTSLASLPKVASNGKNAYWGKFPDAVKAGWDKDTFFPVSIWWGQLAKDSDAKYMKSLGFNTMVGDTNNNTTTTSLMKANNIFWMGRQLQGMNRTDSNFVGDWYDDEVDLGTRSASEAFAKLNAVSFPDHNKPRYTNFTSIVLKDNYQDYTPSTSAKLVNNYTDLVSQDDYLLGGGNCSDTSADFVGNHYAMPITKAGCRTGQGYGLLQDSLRIRDALDGKLQATQTFMEDVPAGDNMGMQPYVDVTPAQIEAAAMGALVHEASGLVWFNNSFGGPCITGNAIGEAMTKGAAYPCYPHIQSVAKMNKLTQQLAPVLNTQSYVWYANPTTTTMLKSHNGSGYLFAMPKSTDKGGSKVFKLPTELQGKSISVVNENRTITPNSDGTFTDSFAATTSYHIYKIG